jgi:hypothetical protein
MPTHSVRGDNRLAHWMCAEVRAEVVRQFLGDLHHAPVTRQSRVLGVLGSEMGETFDGESLVTLAAAFARGDEKAVS